MRERFAQRHEAAACLHQPFDQDIKTCLEDSSGKSADNKREFKSQILTGMPDHVPLPFPCMPQPRTDDTHMAAKKTQCCHRGRILLKSSCMNCMSAGLRWVHGKPVQSPVAAAPRTVQSAVWSMMGQLWLTTTALAWSLSIRLTAMTTPATSAAPLTAPVR